MADIQGNIIKVDGLVKQLNESLSKHLGYLNAAADSMNKYATSAKLPSNYLSNQKTYEQNLKQIERSTKQLEIAEKKLQRERISDLKLQKKREQAFDKYEKQLQREQKLLSRTTGMYNQVQRRVNTLTKQYNDLATKKALNGKLTQAELSELKVLEVQLTKYQNTLKKVDANIGKHQRNVGNYKSGYDGLGMSISQISREMPAFANSMQTGFMAISNNLPIFFDEISRTKKEVAALRAEGIKTRGTLGRLAMALFSFQTLLSVGVTLLTIYGKDIVEWASAMLKGSDATESTVEALEKLEEGTFSAIGRLRGLIAITQDLSATEEQRLKAMQDINSEYPEFNTNILTEKNNVELLNKEVQKYIDLLITRARVKQSEQKLGDLIKDQLKLQERISKRENDITDERAKQLRLLAKGIVDTKELEQGDNRRLTAIKEYDDVYSKASWNEQKLLKTYQEELYLKEKITDETKKIVDLSEGEDDILKGTVEYYEKLISANNEIIRTKKTSKDLNEIRSLQAQNEEYQKQIDLILNIKKANDENNKRDLESSVIYKDTFVKVEQLIKAYEKMQEGLNKNGEEYKVLQSHIDALNFVIKENNLLTDENYQKRVKSAELYQKEKERIEALQKATNDYLKSISLGTLGELGFGSLQTFFDGTFDALMEGADTLEEKFAVTFNAISEVAKEAFSLISQFSQQNFEQQYERLEMQRKVAIDFAGESATAREEIDRQYEEKRKRIAREQAKAQKEQALFSASINIAQGIVSTIGQVGFPAAIPLIAAIAAIGAAQIAMISSQQIPQYWQGGVVGGSQQIMVNDDPYGKKGANYKEVVRKPNGQILKPQGKNVKMNVPKGTEIFPTYDAFMKTLNTELGLNGIGMAEISPNIVMNNSMDSIHNAMMQHTRSVVGAINSKENVNITIDKKGFSTYKGKTQMLNNQLRLKARTV